MSTVGDLKNNLGKLESALKSIKYPGILSTLGVAKGEPREFLPLLHYILLDFSHLISQYFLNRNYEFFGKKDSRFLDAVYAALRDEFSYKPKITRQQFFAKGFAERKCLFIIDVIQDIKKLLGDLVRANPTPTKKTTTTTTTASLMKNAGTVTNSGSRLMSKVNTPPPPPSSHHPIKLNPPRIPPALSSTSPLMETSSTRILQQESSPTPRSITNSPSKNLSDSYFWRIPHEKSGSHYSQNQQPQSMEDDSLLFYQPPEENSNHLASSSLKASYSSNNHHDRRSDNYMETDITSISDTGKPQECFTINDNYSESLMSDHPQTRVYGNPSSPDRASNISQTTPRRFPSPSKSTSPTKSVAFSYEKADKSIGTSPSSPSKNHDGVANDVVLVPSKFKASADRATSPIKQSGILDGSIDVSSLLLELAAMRTKVEYLEGKVETLQTLQQQMKEQQMAASNPLPLALPLSDKATVSNVDENTRPLTVSKNITKQQAQDKITAIKNSLNSIKVLL